MTWYSYILFRSAIMDFGRSLAFPSNPSGACNCHYGELLWINHYLTNHSRSLWFVDLLLCSLVHHTHCTTNGIALSMVSCPVFIHPEPISHLSFNVEYHQHCSDWIIFSHFKHFLTLKRKGADYYKQNLLDQFQGDHLAPQFVTKMNNNILENVIVRKAGRKDRQSPSILSINPVGPKFRRWVAYSPASSHILRPFSRDHVDI